MIFLFSEIQLTLELGQGSTVFQMGLNWAGPLTVGYFFIVKHYSSTWSVVG